MEIISYLPKTGLFDVYKEINEANVPVYYNFDSKKSISLGELAYSPTRYEKNDEGIMSSDFRSTRKLCYRENHKANPDKHYLPLPSFKAYPGCDPNRIEKLQWGRECLALKPLKEIWMGLSSIVIMVSVLAAIILMLTKDH